MLLCRLHAKLTEYCFALFLIVRMHALYYDLGMRPLMGVVVVVVL